VFKTDELLLNLIDFNDVLVQALLSINDDLRVKFAELDLVANKTALDKPVQIVRAT